MKALKFAAIAIAVILVVLLGAAAYIAATFDANRIKGELTRIVMEKKQRSLLIEGDLVLSFWPNVGVRLGRTTLSERGSGQVFAALDAARVSVAVLPLLSKQLVVDTVELAGLKATLVRHKDGSLNIDDLLAKEKDTSQTIRFDVNGIKIAAAQLAWRDEQSGRGAAISALGLNTGRIANAASGKLELAGHLSATPPKSEADFKLAEARMGRSDMAQIKSATVPFRVAFGRCQSASHQLDPKLGITSLS